METVMKTAKAVFGTLAILAALATQARGQNWLTNGLVAYYPFNGNANDASGNGNDGSLVGTNWVYSQGLYLNTTPLPTNGSVGNGPNGFDGTYVTVPRGAALDFNQNFTLSTWVNIHDGLSAYWVHNLISDENDNPGANFRIISDDTTSPDTDYLQFVGDLATNYFDVHAFVPPLRDSWWQAVVVRSGSNLSIFRNGRFLTNSIMTSVVTNSPMIWLGKMQSSCPPWCPTAYYSLAGGINNVRMYDRALSAFEVQKLYYYESGTCSPYRATATATVVNGFVVGATVTDVGCGYTNTPLVLILGGGGTGATATAVVTNGFVVGITITDAGIGYTNTPTVYIYSPFGLQIGLMKAVTPTFSDLLIGSNYQLQVSSDLNNWTNQGSVFTATNPTSIYPQYWNVDNWGQLFFRLQAAP
jgi:hypothetical protein